MLANVHAYTQAMARGLEEKLFCVPYLLDCDVVVDFGCADCQLTFAMVDHLPSTTRMIGYDRNFDLLFRSQWMGTEELPAITLTNQWEVVEALIRNARRPGIVLSSVMHELYDQAQGNDAAIDAIWDRLRDFSVICIRDMSVLDQLKRDGVAAPRLIALHNNRKYEDQLLDFINKNGPIRNLESLVHFLLKYRYIDNWKHELNEDYLLMTYYELLRRISFLTSRAGHAYSTLLLNHYTLPFLQKQVMEDFGFMLTSKTHVQCVLDLNPNLPR